MEDKSINIPKLINKSYEPKDVVAFVVDKMRQYNCRMGKEYADRELELYIDILDELGNKLGSKKSKVIL